MTKLTDDQLRFILDLEVSGAQGEINTLSASIHKLDQANKELAATNRETKKEVAAMEKELAKLVKTGAVGTDKYNSLTKAIKASKQNIEENESEMRKNNATMAESRKKINELTSGLKLSDMTMNQLRTRARQLQQQLDMTSRSASRDAYKKLQNDLADTTKQMEKLRKKQEQTSGTFSTFMGNMYTIAAAKIWKAFTSVIKQAFNAVVDFEKENAVLASVLGTTQKGVKELTEDAKRLGATTSYTASQMTQLQTELAKLGFTTKEILLSTEAVQRFATATGATLPDAAKLAGAALRSFGLTANEMERVVSTMGVATTKSALDFSYLQSAMSTIAPVAKMFGFTIEDTTALLGTLANSGFDASTAATATKNILLNLANSSGKLAKRLGEPIRSMDDLIPALRKLQAEGVNLSEALELTDKRSVHAFGTFLSGVDSLEQLRDGITGVNDELKAMEKERLNTVSGSIDLMRSAWDGLLLSLYNSKGAFKSAIDWLTAIINKTQEWATGGINPIKTDLISDEYREQWEEFKKLGFNAAKERDEKLTIEEKKAADSWTRLWESAHDREDKEQEVFYALQLSKLDIYRRSRKEHLQQLELDEKKKKEEAKAEADKLSEEAYKDEQKKLQDSYKARKAEIIKQEAAMTITAEQSKRKQLELAKEEADAELAFARKHHQETGDLQVKAANATIALNKDSYSRMEKDLQIWLSDSLRDEQEAYEKGKIDQEVYNQNVRDIRTQHLNELKALMEQYGMDTSDLERKIAENEIKNRKDADKKIIAAAKRTRTEALKLNKEHEQTELALLEEKRRLGIVTETQYEIQRRQIADVYAKERLGIEEIYYEAVKNMDAETVAAAQQAVSDATKALDDTIQERLAKAREYSSELRDIFAETAAALGDTLGGQIMGNMANAMDAISQFQEQSAAGFESTAQAISAHVQMIGSVASQALQAASQITQQIFEMEANQLEAAKQRELAAVGDNAEEKERIEKEYAQKELELKKKEADANAQLQTAQLWVNTAMGIATAWAMCMELGPVAGPIMAAILTAALLTTAGIQQNNIIKQRDAIKNQTLGISNKASSAISNTGASISTPTQTTLRDEYKPGGRGYSDGGYTGDGGVHEPAGIVHKGEYVVSQAELRNPSVVPMVRAIEGVRQSRKHGRAGVHGFADGGYTDSGTGYTDGLIEVVKDLADQVQDMKSQKLEAEVNYQKFKEIEKKMDNIKAKGKL